MIAGLFRRPALSDGQQADIGDGLSVTLKVNRRARRVSLRLDTRGRAIATAPSLRRLPEALAFAESRRAWLDERLARAPVGTPFADGATLPFAGGQLQLRRQPGAWAARLSDCGGMLSAGGDAAGFARRVTAFLRTEAQRALTERTAIHAAALGLAEPTVSVGDPKSRWGSCSPRGAIRYSWRLIMSPPEVLDYVAAHEVAHLAEANHGPRYWAIVQRLYGDPSDARAWLRRHGAELHAWGQPARSEGAASDSVRWRRLNAAGL